MSLQVTKITVCEFRTSLICLAQYRASLLGLERTIPNLQSSGNALLAVTDVAADDISYSLTFQT